MTVIHFRTRSREALDQIIMPVSDLEASQANTVGQELFAIKNLLHNQKNILALWTDAALSKEQRKQIVSQLLSSKTNPITIKIISTAVTEEWSSSADLILGLQYVANYALLYSARLSGVLDQVRDELLDLSHIMKQESAIEQNLTNRTVPALDRKKWFATLISGKVHEITATLAIENCDQGLAGDAFSALAEEAAELNGEKIAFVTTASPLTHEQKNSLIKTLSKIYDKSITIATTVNNAIIGGVIVQVDYEIIDGSITGKILQATNTV